MLPRLSKHGQCKLLGQLLLPECLQHHLLLLHLLKRWL
jgi:hypothetical protein